MAKPKITDSVRTLLQDYLNDSDLMLYHSEYVKEGPDRILRVFIDKNEGYIGTDDCETVSRYLSDKLDEEDLIEENYILEVSSSGMDRVLVTPEHFNRYIGEMIEVSLYKEYEGSKKLQGILEAYKDGDLVVSLEGEEKLELAAKDIAKVNLAVII